MIEKLREVNEKLINTYINNEDILKKQLLIKKLLKEKDCFFKIDIETAYSILTDLEISESDLRSIYMELIDIKNYN